MQIFTSIQDFFKSRKAVRLSDDNLSHQDTSPSESQKKNFKNPEGLEPGLEFLDGMSTGTARFIIDREISSELLEKYSIKDLENKGRYYLAKIVNQDGEVADTVLIDKLNRSIHFQKSRLK
jgi:hypothetical protein